MRFAAVLLIVLMIGASLLLSSSVTAQSTTDNQRIEAIEIKGNKRVAAGTVLSYMSLRVGDLVTAGSMNIAIEQLYETDLFADISVDMVAGVLTVRSLRTPLSTASISRAMTSLTMKSFWISSISSRAGCIQEKWRSGCATAA